MSPSHHLLAALLGLVVLTSTGAASPIQGADGALDPRVEADPGPESDSASAQRSYWRVLDVPLGSFVDLERGVVVRAAPDAAHPYVRGPGEAFQGNCELYPLAPERPVGPARLVGRASSEGGSGAPYLKGIEEGGEVLWRFGEGWGYLRLLEQWPTRARIELARPEAGADRLARSPAALVVEAGSEGFLLRFDSGAPTTDNEAASALYRIERRAVGVDEPFTTVAEVSDTTFLDRAAPRDRLVEWRVSRVDGAGHFGALARGARVVLPGEWPLALTQGMRIDLITGALDTARAHLEVTQLSPPTAVLKPLGGTLLGNVGRPGAWRLPERSAFDPAQEGRMRALTPGNELAALTPEGVIVRLELGRDPAGAVVLRRQAAIGGERFAPRAPELVGVVCRPDGVDLHAGALAFDVEDPELVSLVVERELAPDRNDWEVCEEGAPGARSVSVARALFGSDGGQEAGEAATLARVRVRQRYAFGPTSFASEPRALLLLDAADAGARAKLLATSIDDLDDADWARRERARQTVEAFGDEALPHLEALLGAGSPEARLAAQSLLIHAPGSTGLALLYAAEGRLAGIEGAVPNGILAPDPALRAYSLAQQLNVAERGVQLGAVSDALGWAALLARFDPDAGVRGYADMLVALSEVGAGHALGGSGDLAALVPDEERIAQRASSGVLAFTSEVTLPLDARTLARDLERHPWFADREIGPVLGLFAAAIERAARAPEAGSRLPDYELENAELALRLIGRFAHARDVRLLEAARALMGQGEHAAWGLVFQGWRKAVQQRIADERAPELARPRVELMGAGGAPPTLDDLEAALASLRDAGRRYVDLVLPPVALSGGAESVGRYIDLDIEGLRLLGTRGPDGAVTRLDVGVRITKTRGVVLDQVYIEVAQGAAMLALDGAQVVVRGGAVRGLGTGIQAQDADLELYDTEVRDGAEGRPGQWAVRHLGRGRIVASGVLFAGGCVYVGDMAEPYFERCVFDAGERPVLQAQREGRPIMRECLLRSTSMGLVNVNGGCLAAVVMDVPRDPFGARPDGLALDPRWFALIGAGQSPPRALMLPRSPLDVE